MSSPVTFRVSEGKPCPVCGTTTKGCSATENRLHLCRGEPVAGWKMLSKTPDAAGFSHYRHESDRTNLRNDPRPMLKLAQSPNWGERARGYADKITPDLARELAKTLGLPAAAFKAVPFIGWCAPATSWTFPETDSSGSIIGIMRRERGEDGNKKRMTGSKCGLTIPTGFRDRPGPVFLVEGASDVVAMTHCGLAAVGRPSNTGGVELLVELCRDVPAEREIVVIGENDEKENGLFPGRDGAKQTARKLSKALGRTVSWSMPPPGTKDCRQWVVSDVPNCKPDGYAAVGRKMAEHFAANVVRVDPTANDESPKEPAPIVEEFFDPFRLGRLIVPVCGGVPHAVYYLAEWWRWQNGRYVVVADDEMRTTAWAAIRTDCERDYQQRVAVWEENDREGDRPQMLKVNAAVVANALCAAASMCQVSGDVVWPAMLTSSPGGPGGLPVLYPHPEQPEFIAVANGLINVRELLATGRTSLVPATPMYLTTAALPVAFAPDADCPKFMAFLDRVTDGDGERQAVLQEMVGYMLWFDVSQQKFFVLTGDGGNGKSTFLAAKRALIGDHNISSVPLEMFGERFQLTSTIGKLVNAVAEVGEMDRVAEAVLKSFVSGDLMNFDRKNKSALNTRPTARLLLSCNSLPRFTDRSEGVWRRFEVVPFTATITDAEKVKGMDKPEWWVQQGEVPGILNWALVGLHRLYSQGGFTVSKECEIAKGKHRELCNPHRQFLEDHVKDQRGEKVPCGELFAAYVEWCKQRRYMPLADGNFGDELRKVFKAVSRTRPRDGAARVYAYEGVTWSKGRPDELLADYDLQKLKRIGTTDG